MSNKENFQNRLFWKISLAFAGLLAVLGVVFVLIASKLSQSHYNAAHQQLYGNLANHLASFTQPFKNGHPDTTVTHDIIHSTMVANPSVEVYLLDTLGNIVDYVVPDKTVKIHRVNIGVVKEWLSTRNNNYPLGDNPKQPDEASIFSAAAVRERGLHVGYIYVVLSSEEQKKILSILNNDFYFRLGASIFFAALFAAFVTGVITFFLVTRSITQLAGTVRRFKEGDYNARVQGQASGDLGVLTTTFNDMADVIVENFKKITATEKFRQELIANVSHDLRTPLSIMQGYVETLLIKNDQLSQKDQLNYLTIIYESTKRLSGLVTQLFEYAKLEANIIVPAKEVFLINELASDILMAYQLRATEASIHLHLDTPTHLAPVFADIALTERVFQNLLDNAFKFTPTGGSITIQLLPDTTSIKVRVTDTGKGIRREDQSYIFERHKQLLTSDSQLGMGIGLAIVKKILELHESVIEVSSEVGIGTEFVFALPKFSK